MRSSIVVLAVLALTFVAAGSSSTGASAARQGQPRSVDASLMQAKAQAAVGALAPSFPSKIDCVVHARTANVKLDCDTILPNNEPHIVVDPANPLHMVASSNDYDSCCDEFYTTFNGGRTWTTGEMSAQVDATGSDPVTSFDVKHDTVLHSSLNFFFTEFGETTDGGVVVSRSTDGGINWKKPVVVDPGHGADSDPTQVFNDKEWIGTDNNPSSPFYGRTYLTWTRFLAHSGNYVESPIWESHSDNGGRTWSRPHEISGSSSQFCTAQTAGPAGQCDEDQASSIAIGPDGTVSVAFINNQHEASWEPGEVFENQYMVVQSTDGGRNWSKPVHVVDMEDGSLDYPINVDGRQTLSGYQVRVWGVGGLTVNPNTGALYLVFSDNRLGTHDVDEPVTDTKVFLMHSADGASWDGPELVDPSGGDQWFPFADVNPTNGQVGILYNHRFQDGANGYHATLATGTPGAFTAREVSTDTSNPVRSLFFQAGAADCEECSLFHGDYIGLAFGSDGVANGVWTDMRNTRAPNLHLEFIYFDRWSP